MARRQGPHCRAHEARQCWHARRNTYISLRRPTVAEDRPVAGLPVAGLGGGGVDAQVSERLTLFVAHAAEQTRAALQHGVHQRVDLVRTALRLSRQVPYESSPSAIRH